MCLCKTHKCAFTVYPLDWFPYGRRCLVMLTPYGFEHSGLGVDAWRETSFGASIEAALGVKWPKSAAEITAWRKTHLRDPYGVERTQKRHIAGVSSLFALPESFADQRPHVVAAIGNNLSDLTFTTSGRARDGPHWIEEGARGAAILRNLGTPRRSLLPGITRLGVDRGFWGKPSQ
jgi:hypothetical protein